MSIEIVKSTGDNAETRGQSSLAGRLDSAVLALEAKEQEFAEYITELNKRKEEIDKLKESLYNIMTENGAVSLKTEHLLITVVNQKPRESIDTKKIQAIDPKLYKELFETYGKITPVKGFVKITPKKEQKGIK